jgi:hypothetical protein
MKPLYRTLPIALAMALAGAADAAVFTVGSDAACTHRSLGAALSATGANGPGVDEIRLVPGFAFSDFADPWSIRNQSVTLRGGYPTCAAAVPSGSRTTIVSREAGSLFVISNSQAQRTTVTLERLELTTPAGSSLSSAPAGGALLLRGNVRAIVADSRIHDFRAAVGGAIAIRDEPGGSPLIDLRQTDIRGNRADAGGGLHCRGLGTIRLEPGTIVAGNVAGSEGGGVWSQGCSVVMLSRTTLQDNEASVGGGLYGSDGTVVSMLWNERTQGPSLVQNRASFWGGGMFLTGSGTELMARGSQWIGNQAEPPDVGGEGAALLVGWGASARLLRDPLCPASINGCTRFYGNWAQSGGFPEYPSIVDVRAGGRLTISSALFDYNRVLSAVDRGGAIVSVHPFEAGGSLAEIDNTVFNRNQARHLFGAEWTVGDDASGAGRVRAQSLTSLSDQFTALLGSQYAPPIADTVLPVDLRASILLGATPFTDPGRVVTGTLDCLLTTVAPEAPVTRSRVVSGASVFEGGSLVPGASSPAVDSCDTTGLRSVSTDARGRPRLDDDPLRHNRYGPLDLGAVERESEPLLVDPG